MKAKTKLLFVDDEKGYQESFRRAMRKEKTLLIETASGGMEALKKLETFPADIVITDVLMPDMDGLGLLKEIRGRYPDIFVLVVTGHGSIDNAVQAMKLGAYDYIPKPFDFDMVKMVFEKIISHRRIVQENISSEKERRKGCRFKNIIGRDPKMYGVFQMITDVAKTNATVLITGESGTGKELIAEAIHYGSLRRENTLIKVNCAAFTETLINSELFGHEKGAFTGATAQKKGYFELAAGGTIFLDEIGDIPLQTQISLLRVLELKTFQRVGGAKTIKVDIRVVCATNKDLSDKVKEKLFREDLLYRIDVVSIHAPRFGKENLIYLRKRFSRGTRRFCS
jgi:DNA-binding NtrC family response regulator